MTLRSTHKILDILTLFDDNTLEMSIDEISSDTQVPQSSLYRYLKLLCDRGFLEKSAVGCYQLGHRFHMLSRVAAKSNRDLRLVAIPSMQRICTQIIETVTLMRLSGQYAVCIESIEGKQAIRAVVQQGRLQPLYVGASSKILLSAIDEDEWHQYLPEQWDKLTEATIMDREQYYNDLRQAQRNGYAISNGEIDEGGRAVAVPIRNSKNRVVAALSIEGPYFRMGDDVLEPYIALLQKESMIIQAQIP